MLGFCRHLSRRYVVKENSIISYVLPVDWELVNLHKQTGVDAIFHAKEALEQLG